MDNHRYSSDLLVSAQDFIDCGWKVALSQTSREGYSAMWQSFSAAARTAIEEGRNEHGKILWLLSDACSMMLSPLSVNEPFKPYAVFHDRRSVIPDDLTDADIKLFAEIVDAVDDVWLKSRLSDLVWLKGVPKNKKFALAAIDAYREIPLETNIWIRNGDDCWQRGISLCRMLKSGAGDRLEQMETSIVMAFNSATMQDGFLGLWLATLLKTNGLGRKNRLEISKKLESLAKAFDSEGDLHRARQYFSASSDWFKVIPDIANASQMIVFVAEGWVKEAIASASSNNPSHMTASSFYENAIQTYRTIPRSERLTYRVNERISELRAYLNDSGDKAMGEMGRIVSPSIDISQIVENSRKSVAGKSAMEALFAFANLHNGAKVDELRNSVLERMKQFPLQSLFGATVMSADGRVIAKRPAMSLRGELTESDEISIRAEMIRDYGIFVNIEVQGQIWPALETMLLEHRLRETDFVELASQSPIIPKERARLFGKALFLGYERDFVSALHILIPQIEHMVRVHLKQAGAQTTNLDKDGIDNENGLSTLMDLPEVAAVFGKDLSFEIKTLFCDAFGPNLRNDMAHGLLDEEAFHSANAIYAWWLGLKLVFNTWWSTAHQNTSTRALLNS
ncbi:MAG: DUF4209 domain-containing protein [Methylococcales bacterium]